MKIVSLKGGLGNQLFQFAYGRHLEENYGVTVKYEASWFSKNRIDSNRLLILKELLPELDLQKSDFIFRLLRKFRGRKSIFMQTGEEFPTQDMRAFSFFEGYFQHKQIARYVFPELLPDIKEKLAEHRIDRIAVHIRRGDYTSPGVMNHHGLCQWSYYRNAVEILRESLGSLEVDIYREGALDSLLLTQIAEAGWHLPEGFGNPIDDLIKMSHYKGLVISNSTFSWWSSQFAIDMETRQTVVAPYPWLRNASAYDKNLLWPGWIILDKVDGQMVDTKFLFES